MQTAARGSERDQLVGRSLEGRYRILERIAHGGMSTVYAAVDERLDRYVAVKVMSAALSADPNFSDRFAREARAAARLTHLNVVSVYDQGHDRAPDGHHVFLVMELVDGRTLRDLIRERGRLSPAEAVSLMEPVLSALAAAHRAGIVHRDVKPENILLSDDGIVKVADFGLARAAETDVQSTRTGLLMGTVAYCAPETISSGVADPRSDVYAAGVVLFELLTGAPPYRGETAMNVAYQHVHGRVPAPSSRVRGLPEALDELVVIATDRDPDGRPVDAGEFLAHVADARAELALPVTPVPRRERTTRAARPDRPPHRSAENVTTGYLPRGTAMRHDTTAMPDGDQLGEPLPHSRSDGRHVAAADERYARQRDPHQPDQRRPQREDGAPPPPVVISPDSARRRRRRRGWIIVAVVLLIGALAAGTGVWLATHYFAYVPKVAGSPRTSAAQRLEKAGYHVVVEPGPITSETVPKGDVVSIEPAAGSRLTTGQTVTMTLSAGPRMYQIPDVANDNEQQARAALAAVGDLTVARDLVAVNSTKIDRGLIIGTSPKAGSMVDRRQTIRLYVSKGPLKAEVPFIDPGTSVDDATATVEAAGFKIDTSNSEYDADVTAGLVVSCTPDGGMQPIGDTISCTVSKGKQTVTIPKIKPGTPLADAQAQLEALGLQVKVQPLTVRPDPVVVSVDPGKGSTVDVGSTVTLTVI